MDYKSLITNEIKSFKNSNPYLTADRLFEKACDNLKFQILKYFREDISLIFLYSCQVILNGKVMINGKGKTKEDAYDNAIRNFLENIQEHYFIDEINENINNFDTCENLILYCKNFFEKYPTKISKIYRNNLETIKNELIRNPNSLSISETYNSVNENKIFCSIYLNNSLLLHQSCGKDKVEAIENAAKDFFTSYSIIQDSNKSLKKPEFNLAEVLSRLKDHIKADNACANYFDSIRKFVQKLNYKFEVKFINGIATAAINGVKVADAKENDEYSCYILLCHNLLRKINQAKPYAPPPPPAPEQHCIPSQSDDIPVKSVELKATPLKKPLGLPNKYQQIARTAKQDHDANTISDYWGIVNRNFLKEKVTIEPKYESGNGIYLCVLMNKNIGIAEGSGTSKDFARENAAINFIDHYL